MTPEEALAEIAALRALPPGVTEVQFGGRRTTFASMKDIAARLSELEAIVNPVAATTYRLAATRKGV